MLQMTHSETVACDVAEVEANSTSATVAHNVSRNSFKGGHTRQLSSCARCCGKCCIVCPRRKTEAISIAPSRSLRVFAALVAAPPLKLPGNKQTRLLPRLLIWPIITDVKNTINQSELEANTCNRHCARENVCEHVTIGFYF